MHEDYNGSVNSNKVPQRRRHSVPMWVLAIIAGVLAFTALILVLISHTTIDAGYVGVRYKFGEVMESGLTPGWKWHAPFIERIEKVDTREQIYEVHLTAYTADTQTVEDVELSIAWSYDMSQLDRIINNIGLGNVESKLLIPNVNSITKNAIGKYKAESLVQGRSELQEGVEDDLREILATYGINLHSVNIKNIDFEDSFEAAVNAKVVMEQKAQEAANETALKREQANQAVVAAQAEADAARVKAEAEAYGIQLIQEQLAASPQYVEFLKIQQWDGHFPSIMGDTINPFVTLDGSRD